MSDYIKKQDVLDILYNTFEEYNMATDKQDKLGGFGAEVFKRVKEQPTLDEKEIIRKAFERVVEKLGDYTMWKKEMIYDLTFRERAIINHAIKILKEEGGISE